MTPEEKEEFRNAITAKLYELQEKYPLASEQAGNAYRVNPNMNIIVFFGLFGYELEIDDEDLSMSLFNLELAYSWLNYKLSEHQ